jgi:ParB-like chromosome segregation protein Spo0J
MATSLFLVEAQEKIVTAAKELFAQLTAYDEDCRVQIINELREELHRYSPFAAEPVDCVLWVPSDEVQANDYNPNSVAPPEMRLLETSIAEDGYTQPIVAWRNGEKYEVVDGFHRNRVGKESALVNQRIKGYLPLTVINADRLDRSDRMASTIRHNRARGKHKVAAMSDIVVELKRRNWTDDRICRELGMDQDEVLRLCQITGLAELFHDQEFSKAWDVEGAIDESDFSELTDESNEEESFRVPNTDDEKRVFHTYDKWECYKAGFYATTKEGMTKAECEEAYQEFLSDSARFSNALDKVITEWPNSCEHYLTNSAMNRIAWLGQAAACYAMGIPAQYRGGFYLLTEEEQKAANEVALVYLNKWLRLNNRPEVTMEEAYSYDRQSDIY